MERVIVVGAYGKDIQEKVMNDSIIWVTNTRPENEVGSSLQIGLNHVSKNADAVIIAHGDMPMIRTETITGMIDIFKKDAIVIPVFESKKGHPVLIDGSIAKKCMNPAFTHPLRQVIREHQEQIMYFDSSDEGVLLDIDTREDYNRLWKKTK
jgi:CTP:molybdopterin cytidylyltransferase MocA